MTNGDSVVAENKDKLVRLMAKLLELTQEKKLIWETAKKDSISDSSMTKIIGAVFRTKYKDKGLKIYKRERDNTEDNHSYIAAFLAHSGRSSYSETIVLGFTDEQGNIVWNFPRVSGINDLYDAVTYQVAGVDDFINDILTDE